MNYSEAIEYLFSLQVFGARPGLESTIHLAGLAGEPQRRLRFIHVAGTNGKGSTCAILESIYRAAGLRVGLFTSPHLVLFGERIQVNGQMIPEPHVARFVHAMKPWLATFTDETHPTFFEVVTVMALMWFAEQRCDVVIWETGLGGRLDATNIVTPLACAITNIGLDHQQWLGETHDAIAAEKAGIIKPGVPVVTAAEPGRGLEVVVETARRNGAPLTVMGSHESPPPIIDEAPLALLGEHQRRNATVALGVVAVLQNALPVAPQAIRHGLANVSWPGRLQRVQGQGGGTILLDGAHNLDGAQALAATLSRDFAEVPVTLIVGLLADKDWRSFAKTLVPLAARILVVPVKSPRGLPPAELAAACRESSCAESVSTAPSLAAALTQTADDRLQVITGSLYLVGEAMELLGLQATSGGTSERGLNDYAPKD